MPSIAPVPAIGELPPFTIQIGESVATPHSGWPRRWIERQATRATFAAALVATGARSAYGLEQRFGPDACADSVDKSAWAVARRHYWDRFARGESSIPSQLRRGNKDVIARIEAVRDPSELVLRVLELGLWRYLDPAPLTTAELEPKSDRVNSLAAKLFMWPLFEEREVNTFVRRLRAGLSGDGSRHAAIDALWFRMRASYAVEDVADYVLCYLIWLESARVVECDPVLGRVATELFDYAAHHFSRVRVLPSNQDSFEAAIRTLQRAQIEPTRRADVRGALVGPSHIAHIDPVGPRSPKRRRGIFA